MDWNPTEDMRLCQELAKKFAAEFLAPAQRRHEAGRALAPEVLAKFDELGLARIDWPVDDGGAGLGLLDRCVVLEALATADAGAVPALNHNALAWQALAAFGGAAERERWLADRCAEPGATAYLHVDAGQSLVLADGRISGVVEWAPLARLDRLLVLRGDSLHLLTGPWGLEPVPGAGLLASGSACIVLQAAPVAHTMTDAAAARQVLAYARLCAVAAMVGQMAAAVSAARDYAVDRVVFGKPVAHHQAMAFALVDMHMAVSGTRLLLQEAAARYDQGAAVAEEAAQCFAEAAQAADLVGPFALQVHGASGFMRDYPVEKYMRELKTLSLMLGGIDAARADGVPRPVSVAGTGHHHPFLLSAPAVAAEGTA